MSLEAGVDFGSYTPNVTVARARELRERYGIEWASIGLQGNPYLDAQVDACLAGGLKVDTYLIPYSWYREPTPLVQAQLARIEQYKGQIERWCWFDVETLPGEAPGPDVVKPWTATALQMIDAAGWRGAIYTSRSMWGELMDGSTMFGDRALWEAFYASYRAFQPFGGWTRRAGVQWSGSTLLAGLNVDLNVWETREQTMTDEQFKAIIGEILGQQGRLGEKVDAVRKELLIQGNMIVTGHQKELGERIKYEAIAGGVALPYP